MNNWQKTHMASKRIPELDGARGLAILLVLVWHYFQNPLRVDPGTSLAYLKQVLGFTWCGVDLFFVLSGFLIAGILLDKRDSERYFRAFYARRICRIFPLYYLFIGLFAVLVATGVGDQQAQRFLFAHSDIPLWSYVTFTQNIWMGAGNTFGAHWLAITWSLAVEEQFYLFLPLIIRITPRSLLPWVFLWFIIMAPYLRATEPGFTAYINTPWRADSLLVGAMLAYYVRNPAFMSWIHAHKALVYRVFYLLLLGALATNFSHQRPFSLTFTYLCLALLFATLILILLIDRESLLARIFRNRQLMWLGTISFGVYIFHQAISGLLFGLMVGDIPAILSLDDAGLTLLALILTLGLAHVSFRYFERPIIHIGHSFRY